MPTKTINNNGCKFPITVASFTLINSLIGLYKFVRNIVVTSKWVIQENGGNAQGELYAYDNAKIHDHILFSDESNAIFAGINARVADAAGAAMMLSASFMSNPILSTPFAIQFTLSATAIAADYYGYYFEQTTIQPHKTLLREIQAKADNNQPCSSDDIHALESFQSNIENFKSRYVNIEYSVRPLIELGVFIPKNTPKNMAAHSLIKFSNQFIINAIGSTVSWWKSLLMHEVVTPKLADELFKMTEVSLKLCNPADKTAENYQNVTTIFLSDPTVLTQMPSSYQSSHLSCPAGQLLPEERICMSGATADEGSDFSTKP